MYRETSSEESEETSDGGSDYEVSERSDDDGSLENKAINTRTRDKSVMFSISEAIKMRPRNSGISIREPTDSPILVDCRWQKRRQRNTARLPAQRFNNPIVASSSSSAASIVPVAVSSQAQVNNVSGRTITTSSISQVNANTGNITTSSESGLNPSSLSINQDSFFGSSSSSGSTIKRPSSVNLHRSNSASDPIPTNTLPFSLWSSSSGSNIINRPSSVNLHRPNSASHPIPTNTIPFPFGLSNASVQAHANITRQMTSSSQPWLSIVMPNYQQQHDPSSMYVSLQGRIGLTQHYLTGMAPLAAAMQRPYGLRNPPPLLQHGRGSDLRYGGPTQHHLMGMEPLATTMQRRPYGLRNQPPLLQHGRGSDLMYGGPTQHHLMGMEPLAITMQGRPYGLRNQPLLLQHERGLDLNQTANEVDDGKKDESLDLNQPAKEDDDGKKDEGLDLNQPARDE